MDLKLDLGSVQYGHHLMIRTQQQLQQQQRQHRRHRRQQQQLLWTPSTVSPLIFSSPAGAVSAPCSATGPLLVSSVGLVCTNPSWLHSSCTTSAVHRVLSTPPLHPHVSRPLQVKRFGAKHRDTVSTAAASLLSLGQQKYYSSSGGHQHPGFW